VREANIEIAALASSPHDNDRLHRVAASRQVDLIAWPRDQVDASVTFPRLTIVDGRVDNHIVIMTSS